MSDTVSELRIDPSADPSRALIIRPRVLPTTAQFAIEQQLAWKLRNARGFLPNHFMVGDENERAAKILAAIEYARAVGIEPMIALQNTQVIDGKVGASALLIGALLRKAGYAITDDTNDVRSIVTVSKNGTAAKGEFSMQDAARAGLVQPKSGWQKYPRDMMYARALTQAARRGAQDAVLGMAYTAEELGGIEEEIAGVPVLEGEAREVSEAVQQSTGVLAVPSPAPVEVPEPSGDAQASAVEAAAAPTPPPPQTPANAVPVAPLSGANVSRRLGPGRSISPVRRNVTTVQPVQGAEKPATEPEAAPTPVGRPEPILAQPAPPALTDEPVLPEPLDEGQQVYLNTLRGDLRVRTAALYRVNVLLDNVKRGLEAKEPNEVPPATPSEASDAALGRLIDRDFPGRKLANLGEAELQNRLELVEANLAAKRKVLTERGITEE